MACRLLPADARITGLAPVFRRPLMYYRPKQPLGSTFLRVRQQKPCAAQACLTDQPKSCQPDCVRQLCELLGSWLLAVSVLQMASSCWSMCHVQVQHSRQQLSWRLPGRILRHLASLPPANLSAHALQATLRQGTSVKRVASPVSKWIESRHTGQSAWTFHDTELYEHEVNPLQRFLVDSSISGGKRSPVECLWCSKTHQRVPPTYLLDSSISGLAAGVHVRWGACFIQQGV